MSETTGRPLDDDGQPTDGPALEIDPDGPAADYLAASPHSLTSSPGMSLWSTVLHHPDWDDDDAGDRPPELLLFLGPGAAPLPPHVHTGNDETFEAVSGTLTVLVDGEDHHLAPGERRTVVPGETHTFRNDTDEYVAATVELPWVRTLETQRTIAGLDHEGAFARDGGYGEPGVAHSLALGAYVSDGTRMPVVPHVLQDFAWATVGRLVRALGHEAVEERFLADDYWNRTVEQPDF